VVAILPAPQAADERELFDLVFIKRSAPLFFISVMPSLAEVRASSIALCSDDGFIGSAFSERAASKAISVLTILSAASSILASGTRRF
jgi:hypothetical protein